MPRALDRKRPTADYDPNRSGTEFHWNSLLKDQAEIWRDIFEQIIANAFDGDLLHNFFELTGVGQWLSDLFDAVFGAIGLDLPALGAIDLDFSSIAAFIDSVLATDWFTNLRQFLANIDFADPGFNVFESATAFIQNILHPTGTIATEWTFTGFLETALTFDYDFPIDFAAAGGPIDTIVQRFFDHIKLFLHTDFTDPDFNLIAAVEAFITSIIKPRKMLAELGLDELLLDIQAPAIINAIMDAISGFFGAGPANLETLFTNLRAFLSADFTDPAFDLPTAVEDFISSILLPRNILAELGVGGKLLDSQAPAIINEIKDAVAGGIGATIADIENRLQNLTSGSGLFNAGGLANIDLIPALPDHRVPGLELTRDNIVTKLFGWLGSGFSHDDESNALGQQTDVVITHTAQVDMLWAALNGLAAEVHEVTLNSYTDNFSRSGSNLGSNWGEHYNTGAGHWECNGSDAVWNRDAFNTDCRNYNVFTLGTSGTDYQTITVNLGSAPTSTIGGHNGGNLVCGRMSADGSSRIEFFVRANRAWELAKVIAGSRTVMSSGTLSVVPGAGSLVTLICGNKATSTPRAYSCKVGTTVVVPMTTFGDTTSNYGSSYRYMGNGGDMDGGPFATGDPGKMNLWIGQDTP